MGSVLTIKRKNFRCCGTFLSQNSSWYTFRINFLKKLFLIIFDFFELWVCGLYRPNFDFIRPNIGRSVIFSENVTIKVLSPPFAAVNSIYFSVYLYFCEFSSNSIFHTISRFGEEFFPRSSYDKNFYRIKKYASSAF